MKKILVAVVLILSVSAPVSAQEAPQQFQGFDLSGYGQDKNTDKKVKTWNVKGDTADVKGNQIDLTNVDAHSYGEQKVNVTAKSGSMDKESGKMHLEKDVVITTDSGVKMITNSLDWHRNDDLVSTKDGVVITREGMKTVGTGVEAHPNLNTAQIKEDVTVTMDTKTEDGKNSHVTITSDGPLEIDNKKQYAVFNVNVVATETDRTLKADKMEIFFDTQAGQVKKMICTGNVSVIQGKNTTFSDSAVYTADDQKLILSGRPKLILFTEKDADGKSGLGF